ncbi:hypothetical protein CKO22_02285 [Thiococcus pfennigii]|nr:hypothetical protein [Thiococcus pfennigii]
MKTLDLNQAAAFLRMHAESVRRLAQSGAIPSAKPGKAWVFIDEDLAAWLRSQYARGARAAEPAEDRRQTCSIADTTAAAGGCDSPRRTAAKYDSLLARPTRKPPRNTRRDSNKTSGAKPASASVHAIPGRKPSSAG